MKITPAEFAQNIMNYTEDERKLIVLSMSPEELVQLQSLLTDARSSNASTPGNLGIIKPMGISEHKSEPMEDVVINKEHAARGSDEAFSECARVFRARSDKLGSWHLMLDKLKKCEDRDSKMRITKLSNSVVTAYISPIKEIYQISTEYNKVADKVYYVSKLWVILSQNLQNAGMDLAWDSMASGTESLRTFNSGVVTKPVKHKIYKINSLFHELSKFVERRLRFDLSRLDDLMINKARFTDDQLLINMLLKKILICMKYTWENTLELYSSNHQDHWYESTYANLFDTTFIDTCNYIIDTIKPEITRLKDEIKAYENNGYKSAISAHPSCIAYMGTPDVYHLSQSAITRFLQNPERMPSNLSMDELRFYDACSNMGFNETAIVGWLNKSKQSNICLFFCCISW